MKSKFDYDKIVEAYNSGLSPKRIADKLECSRENIFRILIKMKVKRKGAEYFNSKFPSKKKIGKYISCKNCGNLVYSIKGNYYKSFCNMQCFVEFKKKNMYTDEYRENMREKTIKYFKAHPRRKMNKVELRNRRLKGSKIWYEKNKERVLDSQKKDICISCGKKCHGKRCFECKVKDNNPHKYKIGEKIRLCKCGCGKWITYKRHQHYTNIPEYISSHHPIWSKGLTKEEHNGLKKISESRLKEKNPNWNNGSSFEPYDYGFNERFKREIRNRDNQICMLCGIHREKIKRAFDVHHINYNKLLSIQENCISLCNSCHTKTEFNRKNWTKFFQSLLSEKYGYNYSGDGDVIKTVREIQEILR
jgi:hypothetical protein